MLCNSRSHLEFKTREQFDVFKRVEVFTLFAFTSIVFVQRLLSSVRKALGFVCFGICNHFSIVQSHYACKMCLNYPGIKLEPALQR